MKRTHLFIGLGVVVVVVGAVVIGRSCSDQKDKPLPVASASPTSTATATTTTKHPGPSPIQPGGSAQMPSDKSPLAVSAAWGGQLGQLGRDRPQEGNPEAPMSLAVDGKGRLLVLDQVNSRIVRYGPDGKPETSLSAKLRTSQDLAVGDDGTIAALDRFSDKAVNLYDESGKVIGQLPLEGEGIEMAGDVTGVFVDDKDVYVERQHGPLVKLGNTSGVPADSRTEIPGRPSRDGLSFINAGIIDAQAGRAYVSSIERATNQHRFTRELRMEGFILTIVLLDTDRSGMIYFGTQLQEAPNDEIVHLTCLDGLTGQPVGTAYLPANTMAEETFRDLAVLDGGGVIYAQRTEAGMTYQYYDCK